MAEDGYIGKEWKTITQRAFARRLEAHGFFVLTPSITQYCEDLLGCQALEHFIPGVYTGNANFRTVPLTADAQIPNTRNPITGAQMLLTGTNERNPKWEEDLN